MHPHSEESAVSTPSLAIAVITPNALAASGLRQILLDSFPRCEVHHFAQYAELSAFEAGGHTRFFHYFADAEEVMAGASYFLARQRITIVMVRGEHDAAIVPQGFRTLNVHQPIKALMLNLAMMARAGHAAAKNRKVPGAPIVQKSGDKPSAAAAGRPAKGGKPAPAAPGCERDIPTMAATLPDASPLTPRECDVMRGIVRGQINKEIAAAMGVTPTTVITHRKNITAKLGLKSVSALTVYALMHGIIGMEEVN